MNNLRISDTFDATLQDVLRRPVVQGGIGTLGEGTLHAVLKDYYTGAGMDQEVPMGPFVADIAGDAGVIEIQTRALRSLGKKLSYFLAQGPVTVVHPLPRVKWLLWIDPGTGLVSNRRKSPKVGTLYQVFPELYGIKPWLLHPNLRVILPMVDLEEYRTLNGRGQSRKQGAWRYDRIPVALAEEICLDTLADYAKLIPPGLTGAFTSNRFQAAAAIHLSQARTALNILHHVGAVQRTGKQSGAWIYRRTE